MTNTPPNEVALLRFQLAEAQQNLANMQALLTQRWSEAMQDLANGFAVTIANARGGNPQAKQLLEQFFTNLDGAREAANSKLILPPGTKASAQPVLAQVAGGELPDTGEAAEAGNVL